MALFLRKVIHPQAHDLPRRHETRRIGSIGIQHGNAWAWGIDTVIPMRSFETEGQGRDRGDCVK